MTPRLLVWESKEITVRNSELSREDDLEEKEDNFSFEHVAFKMLTEYLILEGR